jgi:hypothetical protein
MVIHGIVVDCAEPARLATFWKAALGYADRYQADDWYSLQRPDGAGPFLSFDKVPEGKTVKNRVHLDLRPEGCTRDEERERLVSLGATALHLVTDDPADIHDIMADPEGNEFCLLEPLS